MSRYVTAEAVDPAERFALYRLCDCTACNGTGKGVLFPGDGTSIRCSRCRGEGRTRDLVATCGPQPEAIGVAFYTLALEGEWDECPIGVLDRMPELQDEQPGRKWLITPWLPSARNISDAGRTLRQARERT